MFWVRSDLDSERKIRSFHSEGGGFWVRSDLDSGRKIRVFILGGGGGVLAKVRLPFASTSKVNIGSMVMQTQNGSTNILDVCIWITINRMLDFDGNVDVDAKHKCYV